MKKLFSKRMAHLLSWQTNVLFNTEVLIHLSGKLPLFFSFLLFAQSSPCHFKAFKHCNSKVFIYEAWLQLCKCEPAVSKHGRLSGNPELFKQDSMGWETQDLGWNAFANWQRILFLSIYQIHLMQKIKILGLCSPEILALMPKDTNMKLFTAVSFVIAKNGKRSKYPPTVSGSINPDGNSTDCSSSY